MVSRTFSGTAYPSIRHQLRSVMKMLNRFIKIVSLSACVAMLTGMPLIVSADDTEIYVGSSSATSDIKPNVVFIIDTSGSMSTDETYTTGTYDPATTYTGSCTSDKIYWATPSPLAKPVP